MNTIPPKLTKKLSEIISQPILDTSPLVATHNARVYRITLKDQSKLVVKVDLSIFTIKNNQPCPIEAEYQSLIYLKKHTTAPTPDVLCYQRGIMIMSYIDGNHTQSTTSELDLARHLRRLHAHTQTKFGFDHDTAIGGIWQDNRPTTSWVEFFIHQRLHNMALYAMKTKKLPKKSYQLLTNNLSFIRTQLPKTSKPALIHGDLWPGNIFFNNNRAIGFIDPCCYFADREFELAYLAFFGFTTQTFWLEYQKTSPLEADFFNTRMPIYQLYALLIHILLLGGHYVERFDQSLMAILNHKS